MRPSGVPLSPKEVITVGWPTLVDLFCSHEVQRIEVKRCTVNHYLETWQTCRVPSKFQLPHPRQSFPRALIRQQLDLARARSWVTKDLDGGNGPKRPKSLTSSPTLQNRTFNYI